MQNESGRSLVEMLGTLAVMGILSLGGIVAFHSAMNKNRINTLIQEAQKRAVVASAQIMLHGQKPNLVEFDASNATEMGRFGAATQEGLTNQFGIQISYMDRSACQALLNAIGDKTPIRRLSHPNTPTVSISECDEVGKYLIIYNDDLSHEDKAVATTEPEPEPAQECETDRDCKTVCGTCQKESNEERGVCVNECEAPADYCDDNTDCNTENDCMICDTSSHSCKDGCKRVEYLESSGTQYINTGVNANSNPKYELRFVISYTNPLSPSPQYTGADYGGTFGVVNGNWQWSNNVPVTANQFYEIDYINQNGSRGAYVNGTDYYQGNNYESFGYRCLLFAAGQDNSGTTKTNLFSAKMKSCSIVLGDTLVRDFIPVLTADNEACLFDKVTQGLFCNAGSGTFKTNKDPL